MNNFLIFTLPEQANALSRPSTRAGLGSRSRVRGGVPVGPAGRLGQGPDCRRRCCQEGGAGKHGRMPSEAAGYGRADLIFLGPGWHRYAESR
jgi:hypothetical protein